MKKSMLMASALMIAMLAMTGCKADSKTSTKETAMTQNVTELIKKIQCLAKGVKLKLVLM